MGQPAEEAKPAEGIDAVKSAEKPAGGQKPAEGAPGTAASRYGTKNRPADTTPATPDPASQPSAETPAPRTPAAGKGNGKGGRHGHGHGGHGGGLGGRDRGKHEAPLDPEDYNLGKYAQTMDQQPMVTEEVRYAARDATALRILRQLSKQPDAIKSAEEFEIEAPRIVREVREVPSSKELPAAVRTQFSMARLYLDEESNNVRRVMVLPGRSESKGSTGRAESKGSTEGPTAAAEAGAPPTSTDASKASEETGVEVAATPQAKVDHMYLLGSFDCMAIPVRADYGAGFVALDNPAPAATTAAPQEPSQPLPTVQDCNDSLGFTNWFYVLHMGAPNIGENSQAEDFSTYAKEVYDGQKGETVWKLDEEAYLRDVQRIWYNAITAMCRLGVSDGILFPIGMGAFLRNLCKNDKSYYDAGRMRQLRRGIATQLMNAIGDIFGDNYISSNDEPTQGEAPAEGSRPAPAAKVVPALGHRVTALDPPQKTPKTPAKGKSTATVMPDGGDDFRPGDEGTITEVLTSKKQMRVRWNRTGRETLIPLADWAKSFKIEQGPFRVRKLHFCMNVVNVQESIVNHNVFIEAASEMVQDYPNLMGLLQLHRNVDVMQVANDLASKRGPLKVAVLNGANRKMLGNHWFQDGAALAIDENLHRRSASMARAALLLNGGIEPKDRRKTELSEAVRALGGRVVKYSDSPNNNNNSNGARAPGTAASKAGGARGGGGFLSLFGCLGSKAAASTPEVVETKSKARGAQTPSPRPAPRSPAGKRAPAPAAKKQQSPR